MAIVQRSGEKFKSGDSGDEESVLLKEKNLNILTVIAAAVAFSYIIGFRYQKVHFKFCEGKLSGIKRQNLQ